MKKKKYLYYGLVTIGNLLLAVGIPALSILVVTPLVAHLLPVASAVAIPTMCLGVVGLIIKSSFSKINKILKNKLTKPNPKEWKGYRPDLNDTKKFNLKKTAIDVAKVISIVQPIYKYILKPIGQYLYKKITSDSEVKKLNYKINELNENIEQVHQRQQSIINDLQKIIDEQKEEIKDLQGRVKEEINKFDEQIKYNSRVIKQALC